ncbi:HelD family protein [Streptomyces sp. NRRL F-5053]|uniref:HelD family protein n=1 Tax=Streptomyces sp. NRRL F-5053 TaxID=1463854 RepID=UPI00099B2D42|nr:ATP-binding domain-containing protein [Streptomyces sp. NRRL F-5053]
MTGARTPSGAPGTAHAPGPRAARRTGPPGDGAAPHDTAHEEALRAELDAERAHIAACRAALERSVDAAQHRVREGAGILRGAHTGDDAQEGVAGDGAGAEALGRYLRSRAKELREEPAGPPFFGRLDFAPAGEKTGAEAGEHAGQRYHIGRRRISEHPSAPPLVLDWRAPVSRAFYQATAREPQGVAVRRRFGWAPGSSGAPEELTGLEDEPLGAPGPEDAGADGAYRSRIVAHEIERPRVGPMRDIVATIQPEQDDIVRAGPSGSVCVQGAPGTGKTAVGLHRAAYLLYTHPRRIERGGLLVVGPNRAFLRYISEVLPSLGEVGVRQCRVADLLPAHEVRAEDPPRTTALKHSARMATVLHRALHSRVRPPAEPLTVPDGSYRWRLPADELRTVVEETLAQQPPYEVGRERVRARVVALLRARAERRAGPPGAAWERRIGRARAVTAFLDEVWPRVRATEVVAGLLGDAEELARAGEGLLGPDEVTALAWEPRRARTARTARWSEADLLLLDEAAGLLAHPEESYAHVVVDEAQDLSPMECRVLARRSRFGSLTVLGDLAQGTTPWAARSWPGQLAHLGAPDARVVPLTTGFRVPAALIEPANRLLAELDIDVPPARSLRTDGALRTRRAPDAGAVPRAVVEAAAAALRLEGSLAVIAADARVPELTAALRTAGLATAAPGEDDGGARVTVVPAGLAKGLEFDHVVLAEPAELTAAGEHGLRLLYVALTRAVSGLEIVHAHPLPMALAGAFAGRSGCVRAR